MANRPVIGIIACTRASGGETAQSVITRYVAQTMRYTDCAALIVPSLPELMTAGEVAPRIDALLLTGSPSNIASELYGDPDSDAAGPFDPFRDSMALGLIDAMIARRRPIFGICRGFQELNVALGGTLRRDLGRRDLGRRDLGRRDLAAADFAHHAPDGVDLATMFAHTHDVALTPGGELAALYGAAQIRVNSVHYQGIDCLAPGLAVEATAPDGVVEAFSANCSGAPVLAVQWHPEWRTEAHPQSQALFAYMGATLRKMLS